MNIQNGEKMNGVLGMNSMDELSENKLKARTENKLNSLTENKLEVLAENKLKVLSENKLNVSASKKRGASGAKSARIQSGHIHVCLIGCNKFMVFYKDLDYIMFLKLLNKYADKYGTIINEIVLMTNHVHILMLTKNLTNFMRSFLNAYVKWYNRNNCTHGRLFNSPFLSSVKFTKDMVMRSQLYILKNPLKAGLCKGRNANYLWSSYGAHFGGKCYLSNFLKVDTLLFDSNFKSKWYLDKAIDDADFSSVDIFEQTTSKTALEILKEQISVKHKKESYLRVESSNVKKSNVQTSNNLSHKAQSEITINYYELCKIAMQITDGRSIFQLSINEIKELIVKLKEETCANYSQIALLTHTPRDYVIKVVREYRYLRQRR
ncbi:MAG: transposase [Bacteroidales bacterium]|nr:transposase [Bacteroidales bacterium]